MVLKYRGTASRGFTLIELLVVIAIIAILAAILFPVFSQARETAKISKCVSNLKQVGTGISLYVDDWGGKYPPAAAWGTEAWNATTYQQQTLVQIVGRYTKTTIARRPTAPGNRNFTNVGTFTCPADIGLPTGVGTQGGCIPNIPVWQQAGSSFDYVSGNQRDWNNYRGMGKIDVPYSGLVRGVNSGGVIAYTGAPTSAIRKSTKKAVLSDVWNWHKQESGDSMDTARRNTLYADGHAARVLYKEWCLARTEPLAPWY